ncbi:IS3 family transposase [Wolbachia endosymbiont (group A) of Dendrolimus pini]
MSNKGCCYDNSVVESFFSSLKRELPIDTSRHSKQHIKTAIFEYIEIFYNKQRHYYSTSRNSPNRIRYVLMAIVEQ